MKKFVLFLSFLSVAWSTHLQAQMATMAPAPNPNQKHMRNERPVVLTNNTNPVAPVNHRSAGAGPSTNHEKSLRGLSGGVKLNEQAIGDAGNLLTVDEEGCNQLSVDGPSNSVVFIHRSMDVFNGTFPLYRYDLSQNGGGSWVSNVGPVTIDPQLDGISANGRFPQGTIYNPTGGAVSDSDYLVYSGTWHNACGTCSGAAYTWEGQLRGVAKLDGDTSTYTVSIDTINGGHADVATSFCQGAPGVFWNLNEDYNGYFVASGGTEDAVISGIIVEKGVWDPLSKNVVWSATEIHQQFDSMTSTSGNFSIATAFNIAFDPTGKYGWISCLGDISNPPDSVYQPIFWYSQDSGTTWIGPTQLNLDSLPGVADNLNLFSYGGDSVPMSGVPTTAFEAKLTVDYLGNPHLFTTVGNGSAYNMQIWNVTGGTVPGVFGAGYRAYDFNYKANRSTCDSNWHGWAAQYIDTVETFVGTYTSDNYQEENRPLVSRSVDGKKLFFYWLDTDFYGLGMPSPQYDSNEYPNLITRAWDLEHQTMTPCVNLTQGDSLFGGANTLYPYGGIFPPGANFPVVANTAIQNGTSYNVGVVLTQIGAGGVEGASTSTTYFWYINNITYSNTDFSVGLAASVQLVGSDTEIIILGNSYVDSGAIINYADTSCFSVGQLHLVTDSANFNIGQTGTYIIYYTAEDSAGDVYGSASRVIEVVAPPIANFGYTIPSPIANPSYLVFHDSSANQPTSWLWNFGDHSIDSTSTVQNPPHQYQSSNTYNVCLTATNAYGHNQKCKQIGVVSGINDMDLSQHISLFPNPSTGKVFIAVDANVTSDYTVSVYDMLGNTAVAATEHKSGAANLEMDLGLLTSGMYMVKIQTADQVAVKRLNLIKK